MERMAGQALDLHGNMFQEPGGTNLALEGYGISLDPTLVKVLFLEKTG